MINSEHKLTIDDLIIAYIIEKTKQGYIPEVTEEEFTNFIKYFTSKKEVEDVLLDYNKLIERFLERKNKFDWSYGPHIDFTNKGILKPNNEFSHYDESIINPNFMTITEKEEIKNYITEYLKKFPKRSINLPNEKNIQILDECKLSSALVMEILWRFKIEKEIEYGRWPKQCKDIFKYLLEDDLATKIELESIRNKLLSFYEEFAKKSSSLLERDKNLNISSYTFTFLPHSNYQLIIDNMEDNLLKDFCNTYGNGIEIDYNNSLIKIQSLSNKVAFCEEDEKSNCKEINFSTSNHAKKLVKAIEQTNKK